MVGPAHGDGDNATLTHAHTNFPADIFVTRVAPSKTFDLLKEDFDYMLILIVLVGLSAASVVVKHLSARKAVKQAWK